MSYSTRYTGVSNLLAPDNCTMILIDHQPLQFAGVQNDFVTKDELLNQVWPKMVVGALPSGSTMGSSAPTTISTAWRK